MTNPPVRQVPVRFDGTVLFSDDPTMGLQHKNKREFTKWFAETFRATLVRPLGAMCPDLKLTEVRIRVRYASNFGDQRPSSKPLIGVYCFGVFRALETMPAAWENSEFTEGLSQCLSTTIPLTLGERVNSARERCAVDVETILVPHDALPIGRSTLPLESSVAVSSP